MKPLEINKVFEMTQTVFVLFFGGWAGSKMCIDEVAERCKNFDFINQLDATVIPNFSSFISKKYFLKLLTPDTFDKNITNSFCSMICVYSFENLKKDPIYKKIKDEPCVEMLRHIRNGSAHGNTFNFYNGKRLIYPGTVSWKGKIIDKTLQDKVVFPDFISPGDVPLLLSDISEVIKNNSNQV